MALLEKEIVKKTEKYKVFKNWKRQQKERKAYNTQIRDMLKRCIDRKNILIDEYWGVMKDLQRVFRIEVDADRKDLYDELKEEIANNNIDFWNIDENIYQKYLDVALTRYELFAYGIANDIYIQGTIDNLESKIKSIEEYERKNASNANGTGNV